MAEGFRLHPDTGKFLVTDNGFAVHEDCCCDGDPCGYCAASTTPKYFDVVFSSMTPCSCIYEEGVGGSDEVYSYNFNPGTVRLTQNDSVPCRWENTSVPCGITVRRYSSNDCTGSYSEYVLEEVGVFLYRWDDGWSLSVYGISTIQIEVFSCLYDVGFGEDCGDSFILSNQGCYRWENGVRVTTDAGRASFTAV